MNGYLTTESVQNGPLVIAHRGASRAFRENTIAAFRGAAALGADWVELDVRRTADRQVVVHHDATVALHDNEVAATLRLPLVELRRDQLPSEIPDLASALAACEHLGVNVEIKSSRDAPDFDEEYWVCEAVVAALDRWDRSRLLVTSFDSGAIDRVRVLDPTVPTGWLTVQVDDPGVVAERTASRGHVALNPWDPVVTPAVIAEAHAAGLVVNVWTVDDPKRIAELVTMGVDGIITNCPDVARAVVDGLGAPNDE
ncbi:MAG: glycerophosphodiester phosphodiesterase [Acidimicrobiales bacterium]|nr:glycerophosphodiester phosphodiesterase [Acidimicrobiales bacterium]